MEDTSKARYLISPEIAQEKAELLQTLAGGKNALRMNQALEAVAQACGFDRWRELVATNARLAAGEAYSLGISALMLADDQHIDAEALSARRALQMEAVRGVITCSHARAQELVLQWALSGSSPGLEKSAEEAVEARQTGDDAFRSNVDDDSQQVLEEALDDALFAAAQESGPDELPYASTTTSPSSVPVSYKKRRSLAGK
ncbi:hypothetical protein [Caballeronia sp. LZ035]|uniref:hypothetical protein n=1 Tax=Caballeronia sp. LZ035 TaxID=3038568 RepID=UPI0028667465|nr:hypothetical protein [Caballeronia sp. LZ035]MDR5758976.1 hypothetical protein [Caballeronia sp. LZ035]